MLPVRGALLVVFSLVVPLVPHVPSHPDAAAPRRPGDGTATRLERPEVSSQETSAAVVAFQERLAAQAAARPGRGQPAPASAVPSTESSPASPAPPPGEPMGTFLVTCYALSGTTASGTGVSEEVVAVDPAVIPLGTEIVVEEVGTRTALDTGGSIDGNRLDIWAPSTDQCRAFGARQLQVWRA